MAFLSVLLWLRWGDCLVWQKYSTSHVTLKFLTITRNTRDWETFIVNEAFQSTSTNSPKTFESLRLFISQVKIIF